ncbi:MAG TPA: kelch repeat-containing protein [Candidatus Limnocylindrales bacterium]
MAEPRGGHTATTLQDGRVLVVGGWTNATPNNVLKSAELFDPKTGKFTLTGSLHEVRANQTATLLNDGRVLIVGGFGGAGAASLKSAELFDPGTGKFTLTGPLANPRFDHTATLLADGRVLIADGSNDTSAREGSAEIYDPATGKFTVTGPLKAARF